MSDVVIPWPATVNQDVDRDPVEHERDDNNAPFKAAAGPPIGNQRTITSGETLGFQQLFTLDEYNTLNAWFLNDLKEGSLAFSRLHPFTQVPGVFWFVRGGLTIVKLLPYYRRCALNIYQWY
jgi:hypothetical protein